MISVRSKSKSKFSRPGRKPAVSSQAIRFVIFDFDGVFTDNRVYVFEDGREAVRCSRADGLGLRRLEKTGVEILVLSTESNPVVQKRCGKMKVRCIHDCGDKLKTLMAEIKRRAIALEEVCFVGNDINDLECLQAVGLPVCVRDAWPEVKRAAKKILRKPGGHGAVREFCDWFYFVRNGTKAL